MAQNSPDPMKVRAEAAEPIIPPGYLLGLAAVGFLVAIFVAATQPTFSVVGIGGLAFGILALVLWVVLAPDRARGVIGGRTARFGGTSLIVTILVLAALVGIYVVVRNLNLRADLTQKSDFSLTTESRDAITTLGADPTLPHVKLTAFYSQSQAGRRDQDTPLFDDYKTTSAGKIDYEFVDPDKEPGLVQQFGVTSNGQIVVAAVKDDGSLDLENAQKVTLSSATGQGDLTNAILKVAAQGEFQAYFLTVTDGDGDKMTTLKQTMTNRFDWKVDDVSLLQLSSPDGEHKLNDPNIDGEVIVVPGGSKALSDQELSTLEGYLAGGGDLVIFAGTNLNSDHVSLATDPNLSAYLMQNFGFSFNNDIVLDPTQSAQNAASPIVTDFDKTAFVTTNGIPANQAQAVFELTSSITIADTPPQNVTVTPLAHTSSGSYTKTDLAGVMNGNAARADGDASGPFIVMAQAENSQTGARVVLVGSTSLADDTYAIFGNIDNLSLAFNSLVWTTDFANYVKGITVAQQQRPQDQPIFASAGTISNVQFLTLFILPFGVLGIGIFVWWSSREKARQ